MTCNRQTTRQTDSKGRPGAGPDAESGSSRNRAVLVKSKGGAGSWKFVTNAQAVTSPLLLMSIILIIASTWKGVQSSGQRGKKTVLCGHLVPISCKEENGSWCLLRL